MANQQVFLGEITPNQAQEWLDRFKILGRVRKSRVRFLGEQMKNKKWKLNGNAIKFSEDSLLDGLQRLHAIIESDCTIQSYVIHGLDKDAYVTQDTMAKRSPADVLFCKYKIKIGICKIAGSALTLIHNYRHKHLPNRHGIDNERVIELWKIEGAQLKKSIAYVVKHDDFPISKVYLSFVHFAFAEKSKELADVFIDVICGSEAKDYMSNALLVRKIAKESNASSKTAPSKAITGIQKITILFRAWNATRKGIKLSRGDLLHKDPNFNFELD